MVEFQNVWHSTEALLEVADLNNPIRAISNPLSAFDSTRYLLESVAKFDDGRLREHAVGVHDELAVLE